MLSLFDSIVHICSHFTHICEPEPDFAQLYRSKLCSWYLSWNYSASLSSRQTQQHLPQFSVFPIPPTLTIPSILRARIKLMSSPLSCCLILIVESKHTHWDAHSTHGFWISGRGGTRRGLSSGEAGRMLECRPLGRVGWLVDNWLSALWTAFWERGGVPVRRVVHAPLLSPLTPTSQFFRVWHPRDGPKWFLREECSERRLSGERSRLQCPGLPHLIAPNLAFSFMQTNKKQEERRFCE